MTFSVLCICEVLASFPLRFVDNFDGVPSSSLMVSGIISIIVFLNVIFSAYVTLGRKSYCIGVLTLSVVCVLVQLFVQFICLNLNMLSLLTNTLIQPKIVYISIVLFLVYILRSKKIKEYLPKGERKFGKQGWLSVGLCLVVLAQFILFFGQSCVKYYNSGKALVENVRNGDSYCDGCIKFKPLENWWVDTVIVDNDTYVFEFESTTHSKITISSLPYYCINSRLDFYYLVSCLSDLFQKHTMDVNEVDYGTEILGSITLGYSTYFSNTDSDSVNFCTYAILTTSSSSKVASIIIEDNVMDKELIKGDLLQFVKTVSFELE